MMQIYPCKQENDYYLLNIKLTNHFFSPRVSSHDKNTIQNINKLCQKRKEI